MADPPHVPPPIPPPPPAAAASSRPKRKRSRKTDPRDSPGALVHALAHNVMGKNAAALMFGNRNYDKTFISGQVISVFDSKKPNAKNSQWSLRVLWNIAGQPSGKEYTILRQHTKLGPVPVGINPQSSSTYADSLNVRAINPCEDRQPTFPMRWAWWRRWTPPIYRWRTLNRC
jgi:hypothetical protein